MPTLSEGLTSILPLSPSSLIPLVFSTGVRLSSLSLTAAFLPFKNEILYFHVPVDGGQKLTLQTLPFIALVFWALPSAAKYPGTVRDFFPFLNVTLSL
ncbi:MAG: hypothetical protein WCS34_07600 [Bacteroidales bacterium]